MKERKTKEGGKKEEDKERNDFLKQMNSWYFHIR